MSLQGSSGKALVRATASVSKPLASLTMSAARSGSAVLPLVFIGRDRRHRWAGDRIFNSLMSLVNSHSCQDKGC